MACQAPRPVRHSSCTSAGIPTPARASSRWVLATARAPATGSTGAVPNARVSCPTPSRSTSDQSAGGSCEECWNGATCPEVASAPTQTPYSCAAFSRTDIRGMRSLTRSAGEAAESRHRSAGAVISIAMCGSP